MTDIFGLPVGIADWMPSGYLAIVSDPQVKVTSCWTYPGIKGWQEQQRVMSIREFLDEWGEKGVDAMTIVLREGACISDWEPTEGMSKGARSIIIVALTDPEMVTVRVP